MSNSAESAIAAPDEVRGAADSADVGQSAPISFGTAIREALRGTHRDYTEGAVAHAILILAIPMVLEMIMESVFAVCDVFFVSKLGASAVATVGLTESWVTLVFALAMGLAIATSAMVARRTGERDREGAARAASQGILLGLALALVLGVAGGTLAPYALRVMGASPDVVAQGTGYARVMLGGNVTIVMLFLINAVFRGAGDAAIAMRVLWLANAINIVLGPCLIFGLGPFPQLGVTGAAIATNIGRGTGALFALSRLLKPGSRIDIHTRHLKIEPELIGRLLQLAWSAALQFLIGMGSWIALVRILSSFGSDTLAGYTIGVRVIMFTILPASGVANAAATMVGQALGARKPDRAEDAVRIAGKYNMVALTALGVMLGFGAPLIARLFTSDPDVASNAASLLRIVAFGYPLYGWGMVYSQSFNGAGDTRTPTLLNVAVFWCWEIPLAFVLAIPLGLGPFGVFLAMTIAFSTYAVAGSWAFKRGTWKRRRI